MTNIRLLTKPAYSNSHALVIGINDYLHGRALSHAANDATEIARLLVETVDFHPDRVRILIDKEATKSGILREFLRFARGHDVELDDRILVFFAGHGHTVTGARGEVGFLVPHDGNPADYSTLLGWDELTRNAELIRAKHMLFIMDACYSGLALTRALAPGSVRFLKDMMRRYSRQVIAAGKGDETVADGGGPLPGHSIFTGHLIEALQGKAANEDGVMTAHGVMSYVYNKVYSDQHSKQTPHHGHFDGDGDFIFRAPGLDALEEDEDKDVDRLISIPTPDVIQPRGTAEAKIQSVKRLLSKDESAIDLHDLLMQEVRTFLSSTSGDNFAEPAQFSREELTNRLEQYERASEHLGSILACVAHWARPVHLPSFEKALARSCDRLESTGGGNLFWQGIRWYPIVLETYLAGIAAVDAQRFDVLAKLFFCPVAEDHLGQSTLITAIARNYYDVVQFEAFRSLPGHEKHRVPFSEYVFKLIQPRLDELLFLGKNYENIFDTFEILLALSVGDAREASGGMFSVPIGRFGWKHKRGKSSPWSRIFAEATTARDQWAPIRNGFFGGSFERFELLAAQFENTLGNLHWY